MGWVTHHQGSFAFQAAQQAAAAVSSGSGSAAGCSPHPYSTFLLPLCPIFATSSPISVPISGRSGSTSLLQFMFPTSKQPWVPASRAWHPCMRHMETLTFPFIPNGTSHHWISKIFPWQRKEKQICKEGQKKVVRRKEGRKEEVLEKCQESTAMGKGWGCLAQGNFPVWVWAEQGSCSLGAASSDTGLQVTHQPVFTAITPRTGLIYLFWQQKAVLYKLVFIFFSWK